MIDWKGLTEEQKQTIYDDWYKEWLDHDCKLELKGACSYCYRFSELCEKLKMKCPVKFI